MSVAQPQSYQENLFIGNFYLVRGDFKKAIQFLENSLKNLEKNKNF